MKFKSITALCIALFLLIGCAELGNMGNNSRQRYPNNQGYGNNSGSGYPRNGGYYGNDYDDDNYSDDDDDSDDDDRRHHGNHGNHGNYGNQNNGPRYNPPPPPASNPEIRPSCPSGTSYDGKHCVITDKRLKQKGGDGNINPCPKGMWVSGNRCVGN